MAQKKAATILAKRGRSWSIPTPNSPTPAAAATSFCSPAMSAASMQSRPNWPACRRRPCAKPIGFDCLRSRRGRKKPQPL